MKRLMESFSKKHQSSSMKSLKSMKEINDSQHQSSREQKMSSTSSKEDGKKQTTLFEHAQSLTTEIHNCMTEIVYFCSYDPRMKSFDVKDNRLQSKEQRIK